VNYNMFNQFIKKPKEEIKPKPALIAEPIKVPVVPDPKPIKKEKMKVEGLNELETKIFHYIRKESNPFPVTIWSISNWFELSEKQIEKICEKFILDPKLKIRKVKHHHADFALEYVG